MVKSVGRHFVHCLVFFLEKGITQQSKDINFFRVVSTIIFERAQRHSLWKKQLFQLIVDSSASDFQPGDWRRI